jgi:CheY-like chemotaxis protein
MSNSARSDQHSLRLLVVEDEAVIAMMLEDILEDHGHCVVDVASSVEPSPRSARGQVR